MYSVQLNSIDVLLYLSVVPYNCIRLLDPVLQSIIIVMLSQISCNTVGTVRKRLTVCNVMRTVNDVPRGVLDLPLPLRYSLLTDPNTVQEILNNHV